MFRLGDVVKHLKRGTEYVVIGIPDEGWTVEKTGSPAYVYTSTKRGGAFPVKWIRPMSEMEDGRFVRV